MPVAGKLLSDGLVAGRFSSDVAATETAVSEEGMTEATVNGVEKSAEVEMKEAIMAPAHGVGGESRVNKPYIGL